MSTGTTVPRWDSVAALYCLQNSMVWTPCGPRAVPTGGAGVAAPASSWILTTASTRFLGGLSFLSFLSSRALELGDLAELELDRGLPPEDVDEDLQLELVLVDLGDLAREVGEGAFLHPDGLVHLVGEARPAPLGRRLHPFRLDLQDALHLTARERGGLGPGSNEPGDARGVADGPPGVVVEIAADEQVAREDLLLDGLLLAALELDHVL